MGKKLFPVVWLAQVPSSMYRSTVSSACGWATAMAMAVGGDQDWGLGTNWLATLAMPLWVIARVSRRLCRCVVAFCDNRWQGGDGISWGGEERRWRKRL